MKTKLAKYRAETSNQINGKRKFDDVWEGDLIDEDDGRNLSLIERMRENER